VKPERNVKLNESRVLSKCAPLSKMLKPHVHDASQFAGICAQTFHANHKLHQSSTCRTFTPVSLDSCHTVYMMQLA
jgi:hypothetical protein